MENAIEYFSVFGGVDIKIDTTKPIEELIEKHILNNYKSLRNNISDLLENNIDYNIILSGAAMGDRRTNSTFKRAKVSFNRGMKYIDELYDLKIIDIESSLQEFTNLPKDDQISERILFRAPFLRFWFAFVSPIFQGIKAGNYEEFFMQFQNRKSEFFNLTFEEISHEFILKTFKDDKIEQSGRYWDGQIDIDILTKTVSGKVIAGVCKYTNSKIKKSELTKLKTDCELLGIKVDTFVIFSKKGYSSELKNLKGETLKLYTVRNFNQLI